MKLLLRHIFLVLMSFVLALHSYAAPKPIRRDFDPAKIEKYKDQSSYQYGERFSFSIADWVDNWLTRIFKWLDNKFDIKPIEGNENISGLILWGIGLLAIAAIIFIILKGKWAWLFSGKKFKKKKEQEYSVYDEDIHSINFTDEIELSVQSKNYRKATRLFYLKSLKLLSDAGHIDWQINKTNTDYRREIKSHILREEFDYLSTNFEYVWYGEFEPTEERFLETFEKFRRFNNRFVNETALS